MDKPLYFLTTDCLRSSLHTPAGDEFYLRELGAYGAHGTPLTVYALTYSPTKGQHEHHLSDVPDEWDAILAAIGADLDARADTSRDPVAVA